MNWMLSRRGTKAPCSAQRVISICVFAGIWQGRFIKPEKWRRGERLERNPVER